MNYNNPTLARLLAKENISVQHGNYKTAWFDIKNRTLGLPMWKDKGKDVYDLLVGHEVGHALYTPFEGWHDSPEKLEGCPRSYINVIEDARIERLIRNIYPGLVGPFSRGYNVLVEDGFFGDLDDVDYTKVKLIDKINLKCKLDRDIKVPFNEEELSFYARSLSTESFEEVVQLCRDILEYTKENQPELLEPQQPDPETSIPGLEELLEEAAKNHQPPMGHDDMDPPEKQEATASTNSDSEDEDESDDCKENNNTSSESNDDDTSSSDDDLKSPTTDGKPTFNDEDKSITDHAFRKAERELLDLDKNGRQKLLTRAPKKEILKSVITSFDQLMKEREWTMSSNLFDPKEEKILEGFDQYMIGVKKSSQFAVKEFELHKAAYQWQRAQTAKTGSLDMNKVHAYKFNEDIFKRVTRLADSKNHGMIMMIDYSGSMGRTIGTVIDQLLHLVTFCKMINIPYDVYAFTTRGNLNSRLPDDIRQDNQIKYSDGDIDFENTSMPLLISSSLKKAQYQEALKHLYMKKQCCDNGHRYYDDDEYHYGWNDYNFSSPAEVWGSTPLNHALILGHYIVKEFRIKHNIDKMNLIILSDGDSNHLNPISDSNLEEIKLNNNRYYESSKMLIDGKTVELTDNGRRATRELAANISKRYKVKTLGFFVSDANDDWRNKLYEINMERNDSSARLSRYDSEIWSKANKEYRKNKCVVLKNALGYDELYLVKGGDKLSTKDDDFEVSEEASNAQIRNAFKKFSKSKKLNKVLMTTLGKAIA